MGLNWVVEALPCPPAPHFAMAGSIKPKEILATLDAMLRVVTPDHPFQPVLAASIDPHVWRAVFVQQCKTLKNACKEAAASDTLQEACGDLHEFAATLYADSYFDHFHADDNPDRDAEEFAPDQDFFDNNPRWLTAKREARPAAALIQDRVVSLDDRWKKTCNSLSLRLEEGPYASVLPAVLELAGADTRKKWGQDWLSPPLPGPNHERRSQEARLDAEVFVIEMLLPNLEAAVNQAFPSPEHRGVRQQAKNRLKNAAADVLATYHLRHGWKTLLGHATAAAALRGLLVKARKALTNNSRRTEPLHLTGKRLLASLRRISPETLDPLLKRKWSEHIGDPAQREAVICSLHVLSDGHTAISQDMLGEQLRKVSQTAKDTGWTDKAEERLWKLRSDMLAIHGAENWIHQSIEANAPGFRRPRKEFGWLVNPLLVVWDEIYKAL